MSVKSSNPSKKNKRETLTKQIVRKPLGDEGRPRLIHVIKSIHLYCCPYLVVFVRWCCFCCAFVLTVFYSFYNKKMREKTAFASILIGLIGGFLLFPAPDFSKSLLVGVILPIEFFPIFVTQSLLFLSFVVATILPVLIWKLR